jgi:hypothetical protein
MYFKVDQQPTCLNHVYIRLYVPVSVLVLDCPGGSGVKCSNYPLCNEHSTVFITANITLIMKNNQSRLLLVFFSQVNR